MGLINEQPKQFYNILTSILLIEYKTINHIGLSKHKQITEYLIINCYTTSYIISDYQWIQFDWETISWCILETWFLIFTFIEPYPNLNNLKLQFWLKNIERKKGMEEIINNKKNMLTLKIFETCTNSLLMNILEK